MNLTEEIYNNVKNALVEDMGSGDLSASLISQQKKLKAKVISRENMTLCGVQWFEACFLQLSQDVAMHWYFKDGDQVSAEQEICEITGQARELLAAERTALNFLQTLSAVATQTRRYVTAVSGIGAAIVDTRKTLPGLRLAQKYAVKCAGGVNHRFGLYDGVLIKENHIIAAGGIGQAMQNVKKNTPVGCFVQVEVETLEELREALKYGAEFILLDNFSLDQLKEAVAVAGQFMGGSAKLEASGNITLDNVAAVAHTGVDRISIGSLTKNIKAIDLSMRFQSC